jgi:hypothetical protein
MLVKPGIKTTEFWATIAVNLAIFISTFSSSLSPQWQIGATLLINGLYIFSRTIVKFKSSPSATSVLQYIETYLKAEASKSQITSLPAPPVAPDTSTPSV